MLAHSAACLRAEGREHQIEPLVWAEDTHYPPILSRPGQRSVYYHMDDLPPHVSPLYPYLHSQRREFFQTERNKRPWSQTLFRFGFFFLSFILFVYALVAAEVWIHQPRDVLLMREEMLQNAYGRVLELGAGQGSNVGLYPYPAHEVWMMDQDVVLLRRLEARLPRTSFPAYHILQQKVEDLERIPSGSFDTVVDSYGLCHYRDPVSVLREVQRIVKPTGVILLLEHGRTEYPWVNAFLDFYADRHAEKTAGCRWNRPVEEFVKESGMVIKDLRRKHFGVSLYCVGYPTEGAGASKEAGG